jgi:hypothetical protein
MQILKRETERFWSDTYCGRPIAILNRGSGWHVYLNHVLQHSMMFETAEEAIVWLMKRIEQGKVSNKGSQTEPQWIRDSTSSVYTPGADTSFNEMHRATSNETGR